MQSSFFSKMQRKLEVFIDHYSAMGVLNASHYIAQRIFKHKGFITARVNGLAAPVLLRNIPADTQIFAQIFVRCELNIPLPIEPCVIVDAGANIGLATLYLKSKYPLATIISIEPESSNFELLRRNTQAYQDIHCLNSAIWGERRRLTVVDTGNGEASFVTEEVASAGHAVNTIDAITISDVINDFHLERLDLIKIDIEGSEQQVFQADYEPWLSRTAAVVIEIHRSAGPDCENTVLNAFERDFSRARSGEYDVFTRI